MANIGDVCTESIFHGGLLKMMLVIKWIVSAFTATLLLGCIKADECGRTKGCFRVPSNCKPAHCNYFLSWQNDGSDKIRFEYTAQFITSNPSPWASFGISTSPDMFGATVVDCIVMNGNQVVVQMSYNSEETHDNSPLKNKYLGLVQSSLTGSKVDSHISCNFTRWKVLSTPDPENSKVQNLTLPYYILFATGPTDDKGLKQRHDFKSKAFDPFSSDVIVDFNNCTDTGRNPTGATVKVHVTLMIFAWMVLASLAMVTSRYMKNQWKENGAICGKPIWFQVHRYTMALVFALTLVGILLIFSHKNWKLVHPDVKDASSVHPVMGITVGCLLVVNILAGLFRPHLYSPYRPLFFWCHSVVGHGTHLAAAVTMYLGVMQSQANMPPWSRWVIVGFAVWRILSDVLLTGTKLSIRDPPVDYVSLANNEVDDDANRVAGWRCAILIVYLIGVLMLAVTLMIAVNISA